MKDIFMLIGPPFAGKGTHATMLSEELGGLPVYSIGHLIREARKVNPVFEKAYQEYSMQGKHLPDSIKFPLLEAEMNKSIETGFVLDNYPATMEDLEYLERYIQGKELQVKRVIYLHISLEEMKRRYEANKEIRGRMDDSYEIVHERRVIQDKDRDPVLEHYRSLGLLAEVNGEGEIDEVEQRIRHSVEAA